jgi:hypothetical protein
VDIESDKPETDEKSKNDKKKRSGYEPVLVPKRVLTEQQKKLLSIADNMPEKNCKIGL